MLLLEIITIFIFSTYSWGFGYSLSRDLPNNWPMFILRLSIGIGFIPILAVLLNLFKIPLDWRIFLCISLILPLKDFLKCKTNKFIPYYKPNIWGIAALCIFLFSLWIYTSGAFNYPWLEDDDSWAHAAGVKYISIEKNISPPSGEFYYLNPYPPAYDLLLGLIHQTHPSIYWVLKFFNALMVSLSILYFYIFIKEFTQNNKYSFVATFIFSCIPCYASHFIWAISLIMMYLFPALYFILKSSKDRQYILPTIIFLTAILLTQPTHAMKFFVLFFILFLCFSIFNKSIDKRIFIAAVTSCLLALMWWGPIALDSFNGKSKLAVRQKNQISQKTINTGDISSNLFDPKGGSATRSYYLTDYIRAPEYNLINNPIGIGWTISFLSIMGLIYLILNFNTQNQNRKIYLSTILGWLVFTFLGLNSQTFHLPIGLYAFRFWMLFAIPVALLAAEGFFFLISFFSTKFRKALAIFIFLIGIIFNSAIPKIQVNTGMWPFGVYWQTYEEIKGYCWLRKYLPTDTKVFSFTDNLFVIGHDMRSDYWREDYKNDFNNAVTLSIDDLHHRLIKHQYAFLIIGTRELQQFGEKLINEKIKTLKESKLFRPIYFLPNGVIIFQILEKS